MPPASIPTWLTVRSNRNTQQSNKLDHGFVVTELIKVSSVIGEVKEDVSGLKGDVRDLNAEVQENRSITRGIKADVREVNEEVRKVKSDVRALHGEQVETEAQVVQLMQASARPHQMG